MTNEFDDLLRAFSNGKRPQNLNEIQKTLASDESRRILAPLMEDGGAAIKQALRDAQRGKTDTARDLVDTLMKTPGGAALITKILNAAEGRK